MAGTRGVDGFDPALLRAARLGAELTQEDLGRAAGVPRQNLVQMEGGSRRPQADVLARLARALGIRPSALLAPAGECGLKRLRTEAGLLQQDAARALLITRSAYAMLEAGRTAALDDADAAALAEAFGVERDAVLQAHRHDVQRRTTRNADEGA